MCILCPSVSVCLPLSQLIPHKPPPHLGFYSCRPVSFLVLMLPSLVVKNVTLGVSFGADPLLSPPPHLCHTHFTARQIAYQLRWGHLLMSD